jgi:hypothetical protein
MLRSTDSMSTDRSVRPILMSVAKFLAEGVIPYLEGIQSSIHKQKSFAKFGFWLCSRQVRTRMVSPLCALQNVHRVQDPLPSVRTIRPSSKTENSNLSLVRTLGPSER